MRILMVVHGFPPRSRAGTEIHVRGLASALAGLGHEVRIYAKGRSDQATGRLTFSDEDVDGLPVRWVDDGRPRRWLSEGEDPDLDGDFEGFVEETAPDVVHLHHLIGLSTGFPAVLGERGVPYVVTLHDAWFACARASLLYRGRDRCAGPEGGALCASCFADPEERAQKRTDLFLERLLSGPIGAAARLAGLLPESAKGASRRLLERWAGAASLRDDPDDYDLDYFQERFGRMGEILSGAAARISPSARLAERLEGYGLAGGGIRVIRHGYDLPPRPKRTRRRRGPNQPLRVGCFGTLSWEKGTDLAVEAFRTLAPDEARLVVAGRGNKRFVDGLKAAAKGLKHVRFAGPYATEHLADMLGAVDAAVVPSRCIENAPTVIQEAFHFGVPVLCARGAGDEFVVDGASGLVFESGSADELARAVGRLARDPELLAAVTRGVPEVPAMDPYARTIEAIYREAAP